MWVTEAGEGANTSRQSRESHVETRPTSRCVLHCCVGVGVIRHAFHLAQILRAQALSLKFLFTARTQGACSQLRCGKVPVRRFRVSFRSCSLGSLEDMKVDIINSQVDRFIFPVAHDVIVLASDRLRFLNLVCDTGYLSFEMSCSFTVQGSGAA